eukprot:2419441-Pleurochrysis_carterae.AAC.4
MRTWRRQERLKQERAMGKVKRATLSVCARARVRMRVRHLLRLQHRDAADRAEHLLVLLQTHSRARPLNVVATHARQEATNSLQMRDMHIERSTQQSRGGVRPARLVHGMLSKLTNRLFAREVENTESGEGDEKLESKDREGQEDLRKTVRGTAIKAHRTHASARRPRLARHAEDVAVLRSLLQLELAAVEPELLLRTKKSFHCNETRWSEARTVQACASKERMRGKQRRLLNCELRAEKQSKCRRSAQRNLHSPIGSFLAPKRSETTQAGTKAAPSRQRTASLVRVEAGKGLHLHRLVVGLDLVVARLARLVQLAQLRREVRLQQILVAGNCLGDAAKSAGKRRLRGRASAQQRRTNADGRVEKGRRAGHARGSFCMKSTGAVKLRLQIDGGLHQL